MASDEYKTIVQPVESILFKDRNSKFYGYIYNIKSVDDANEKINKLKAKHHSARHWCYAYRIGLQREEYIYRANDDGEPNNSAGMPIYGQILSFDLTNIIVIVVRYFGGTKLGVSGLINAYRTTAEMTLKESKIITNTINKCFLLTFDYDELNNVMRIIKEHNFEIISNESTVRGKLKISVRLNEIRLLKKIFQEFYKIEIVEV